MNRSPLIFLVLTILLCTPATLQAQGSRKDYQRAMSIEQRTQEKVFRDSVQPHWSDSGNSLWYRVRIGPNEHEFVFVDAKRGTRMPAFDHQRLAAALTKEAGKDHVKLTVETTEPDNETLAARIREELFDLIGLHANQIEMVPVGAIERLPGKAVRVVDER